MMNQKTSQLQAYLTTSKDSMGENVISNGRLIHRRWNHITIARTTTTLQIYWNGILDSASTVSGISIKNTSPLYIGGAPMTASQCSNNM